MRTRSSYARRPPHMESGELFVALHLAEQCLGRLGALKLAIVRRHVDPPGWQQTFADALLECECSIQLLREQIDHNWPEPPEAK